MIFHERSYIDKLVVVGWQLAIGAICWLWLICTVISIFISGTRLRQQVVLAQRAATTQAATFLA